MSSPVASLSSSHVQVPLLIPAELRDSVLNGAAEIVVENGARRRCFLHIHSEEERVTAVESSTDPNDVVRRAHERWLEELRWARAVLWDDHRLRRFVRHGNHLVWPAQEHVDKVAAVVRQLIVCDEDGGAAALKRANDIARASEILAREAAQPGLHLLRDSTLPGQAVLYKVEQTRKRERDASAPSMPSVLSRVDGEAVEAAAWIAEVNQLSHAVSAVLQLQLAAAPLRRLVELLQKPSAVPSSSPSSTLAVRQRWKALVDQHRAWAEYQSLFADVAEICRSWGMSETCVAREVDAAIGAGCCVHLRTGVYMSVLHRRNLFLLLSARPRKLESVTAAEQHAVEAAVSPHTWVQCLDEGLVRVVPTPTNGVVPAALEPTIRQLFLSPTLSAVPLGECCAVSDLISVGADMQLVKLSSSFNPYVVVHGSRVDGGFAGDMPYYQSLQRERDRLVEERTNEQLRRGSAEPSPRGTASAGTSGSSVKAASSNSTAPQKRQPVSTAASDATNYLFKRSLVSVLAIAPSSKAEIQQHPSMQQFKSEANFDALLNAKLKEVAEFKGRKYQLRS
ncbi:hypothetical protein ABB37_09812 [Leptomonas pyrrhocoris]|uniref:Uncharacterized protein n=1 Tax=Leptomonas pyrrhocoris TaxID=157538 RepID=A0A0N0DQM1_LEPPY|nr:hypothetical protein ABB37_09812 [Leptomonas pyrrhocoris]XP_015651932.1 hypothetical protein ABB37_09812 [Leptomonas pyrrhocoris]KPA73492.1 hypothetical protein ABB37_09812 [Leptomonas pyrrhocoris]KPA73493.1 hypothetical protein ABB37_09812 [Leptomonas pyrrhocoris]|eukprot:XP_015651931.1 hypothetical protein ABB37_09812 [Leptomonas pyrrhocoris]